MSALVNPLVGFLVKTYAQLWWGTIQVVSANISGVAAVTETAAEVGGVVTTAAQGVTDTAGSLVGVVATAGQGVLNTFGKLFGVAVAATRGVGGYASDLITAAQVAVGINLPVTPEAQGITQEEWKLLADGHNAIEALQAWSNHKWPDSPELFTEDDVKVFLPAGRVMAVASALGYAEQEDAQALLGMDSWTTRVIDHNDAQAMLYKAKDQPVMIVAFRGTQLPFDNDRVHTFWPDLIRNWQFIPDWIRNFDVTLKPYDSSKPHGPNVHDGFLAGWRALQDLLTQQIQEYYAEKGETVQLFVTGHSQGAALAGVSLLDLLLDQQKQKFKDVYSVKGSLVVAAPKHGDQAYTEAVRKALVCASGQTAIPYDMLANQDATGCDPVVSVPPPISHLPPCAVPAGRLWIVRAGRQTRRPATPQDKEEAINASLDAVVRRIFLNIPLHAIGGRVGYLSALRE